MKHNTLSLSHTHTTITITTTTDETQCIGTVAKYSDILFKHYTHYVKTIHKRLT